MQNNWFVITGGPCSGKTTTINLLKKKGFIVTPEAAREYYESQMKLGFTNEQIRSDPQKLQDGIAQMLVDLEKTLNPKHTIFLDRGIPDNYAYYTYYNINPPQFIKDAYNACSYKKVFYLERIPLQTDNVRNESEDQAQYLADLGMKYYSEKKADIVRVQLMDQKKRIEFILENIDNSTP